jgi:hypothetical protein
LEDTHSGYLGESTPEFNSLVLRRGLILTRIVWDLNRYLMNLVR